MKPEKSDPSVGAGISNAVSGLSEYAQHSRRNLVIESLLGLIVLGAAFVLEFDALRLSLIVVAIALVMSLEILNTALEALLNAVTPGFSATVKFVKDLAAAAVLIASLGAVALGLLLFWEPLGLPAFETLRFFVIAVLVLFLLGLLFWSFVKQKEQGNSGKEREQQ